jgi:hypothetical protein
MIERLFAKTEAGAFGEETTALYAYALEIAQDTYHRYECDGSLFNLRHWQNTDSSTFQHLVEALSAPYILENFTRRAIFTFAMAGINEDSGFHGDYNRFFYGLLSDLKPEPAFDVMVNNGYLSFIPLFDVERASIPPMLKTLALNSNVKRLVQDYPDNTALYYKAASLLSFNTRADFVDPDGSSHEMQRIINNLQPVKIHQSSPQIYDKHYNLFMSVLKRPETFRVSVLDVVRYFLVDFDREYLRKENLTDIRQERLEEHLQVFVYGPGLQLILEGADREKLEVGLRSVFEAIVEPLRLSVAECELIFRAVLINLYYPFPELMATLNVEAWEIQGHLSTAQEQLDGRFACPFGGPLATLTYRFSGTGNVLIDGVLSVLRDQGFEICFDSVVEGYAPTAVKGHLLKEAGGMTEKFQRMLSDPAFDSKAFDFNALLNYINADALPTTTQVNLAYHLLEYNNASVEHWHGIFLANPQNRPRIAIDAFVGQYQLRAGLIACLVERGQLTAAIQAYLSITGSELQATGGEVAPERWQSGLELDLGL